MVNNVSHKKLYKQVMYLIDSSAFSHKEISVSNYSISDFYDVLLSELLLNIRLVLENEKINNLTSMGVDVCCRVIIEICSLLAADKKEEFTDEQKKLFLLQFLATDIQKKQQRVVHEELRALLKNPYDLLINEFVNIIGCSQEEAGRLANRYRVYIEYGGRQFKSFGGFVKRYLGEEYTTYREKLNLYVHPSYSESRRFFHGVSKLESEREKIINRVLTLGAEYLPPLPDTYIKSRWEEEVFNEENLLLKKQAAKEFDLLFKKLAKKEIWKDSILENDNARLVVFSALEKLSFVMTDFFLCESLGLNAQVMARAKSFIEMTSLLGVFMDSDDIELDIRSFKYMSILSLYDKDIEIILKKASKGQKLKEKEQEIYDTRNELYITWYHEIQDRRPLPDSEEDFLNNAPKSLIYYVRPDLEYRYRDLVKEMLNKYIRRDHVIRELVSDYDFSARLGHASAYKSKLKENKMFSLIPNLMRYLASVVHTISGIDEIDIFVDGLNSIAEEIEQKKNDVYTSKMNKTYKGHI